MDWPRGFHVVVAVFAIVQLVMLVFTLPIAYLILGLEYFPGWYRPAVIAILLAYAFRAMFYAEAAQFICPVFLSIGCPFVIGVVSRFSERVAESSASVAALIGVIAPLVIATFSYVVGRVSREKRHEPP